MKKVYALLFLSLALTFISRGQRTGYPSDVPEGSPLNSRDSAYLMNLPVMTLPEAARSNPLPPVVDNSELPYLRPVFRQEGSSCGQACLVGYNFTYETDRMRDLPADSLENQYATHFSYNFMNGGNGWYGVSYMHSMEVLRLCGNMNVIEYGGNYDNPDGSRWVDGYDTYYNAMFNRINGAYSINTGTMEGLMTLKHWLFNHMEEGSPGGVASFYANTPWNAKTLNDTTPEGGKMVMTAWTPNATHAMTIVGYNDSIRWDYNNDGIYTNDIDLNDDGLIDARDWEIGGVKFVNSHGETAQDSGFCYMMFKALAESFENGGIWNQSVHVLDIKENYEPQLTYKIKLKHNYREKIKVKVGVSTDTIGGQPQHIMEYPIFNFQGANHYMQGQDTAEYLKTIEFGLDVTPLLSFIEPDQAAKFFLIIEEDDPNNEGTGDLIGFSLMDYRNGLTEVSCQDVPLPLKENTTTSVSIIHSITFDVPQITTESLTPFTPGNSYSQQLTATGGNEPYTWDIVKTYVCRSSPETYHPINGNQVFPDTNGRSLIPVPLDFPFPFYGEFYDTVYVNTNGFLQFTRDQLPWPYLEDHELLLKKNRMVAPLTTRDFTIDNEKDDGVWYQADASHITVQWKLSYLNFSTTTYYDFSATLYPSGTIEFNYNQATTMSFNWISGISMGDKLNYLLSPVNNLEDINQQMMLQFTPFPFPTGMQVTREGNFHGTPSDDNNIFSINFRVTDNNNISSTRLLQYSNGPEIKYIIHSGLNNQVDYGETLTIGATIYNNSNSALEDVQLSLEMEDPYITIQNAFIDAGNINAWDSTHIESCFVFSIDHTVPDQHSLWLSTDLNSGEKTWQKDVLLKVNSPVLKLLTWSVEDGNDHLLEPGETSDIHLTLINEGSADMSGVTCQVTILDPVLELTSSYQVFFNDLVHGHSADGIFSVYAKEGIISGYSVSIELLVTCDQQLSTRDTLELKIGKKPVLVLDLDPNNHTGPVIYQLLEEIGVLADYRSYIPGNLSAYQSLFVCLGYHNSNYELNWYEGNLLANYLDAGGNIYLEGRKTWKDDIQTPLHDRFNLNPEGTPAWLKNLSGVDSTFTEGILMFNSATQPFNFYWLEPMPPAYSILYDTTNLHSCAIAYDQGTYKTVGSIIEMGSLEDGEHPSSKLELLLRILDFFEVDYSLTGLEESAVNNRQPTVKVFPNPSQGITSFGFRVSGFGKVTLKIYDLHGRVVATVVDGVMSGGGHVIRFDASSLPPGMYFVRIYWADNSSITSKFLKQ